MRERFQKIFVFFCRKVIMDIIYNKFKGKSNKNYRNLVKCSCSICLVFEYVDNIVNRQNEDRNKKLEK